MAKTISEAKSDKYHIMQLLKNQASIIDSTINVTKQDELQFISKLDDILNRINREKNEINKEFQQISNTLLVVLLSAQLC